MITIKEAPQTDLVYYSRLSDEAQNNIITIKSKINDLIDYLNENSVVFVTLSDYNLDNVDDQYFQAEDFDDFLEQNELKKKYVGRSEDFYIRSDYYDYINDFLYELEDTDINFNTVCVAIEVAYLTYDEYYSDLLDNNFDETKIDEMIKNDIMSGLSEKEVLFDVTNAISDLKRDITNCVNDIKFDMKPIIEGYEFFDEIVNGYNEEV
jgi:hypothetical protein